MSQKIDTSKLDAAVREHIEKLEADLAKATKPADPATTTVPDDVMKSLPEAVRKRLEKAEADATEAVAKAKKAEDDLAIEKAAREFVELKKRVDVEYPSMPGTVDEKAAAVQKAEASGDKHLLAMLRAGEDAIRKQVLDGGRANGRQTAPIGGAFEQLSAIAKDLKEKNKSLTAEQAFAKAATDNPKLYKQYRDGE